MFAEAEARFHNSVTKRVGLKEWGFDVDPHHFPFICSVIESKGWQKFCKPPNVVAITIVREFYANAKEAVGTVTLVREN